MGRGEIRGEESRGKDLWNVLIFSIFRSSSPLVSSLLLSLHLPPSKHREGKQGKQLFKIACGRKLSSKLNINLLERWGGGGSSSLFYFTLKKKKNCLSAPLEILFYFFYGFWLCLCVKYGCYRYMYKFLSDDFYDQVNLVVEDIEI